MPSFLPLYSTKISFLLAAGFFIGSPAVSAQTARPDVNGRWEVQFGDSIKSGGMTLDLAESDGKVSGKYRTSTGSSGLVNGTLEGRDFHFTLAQTVESCPGAFTGVITFNGASGSGQFSGKDCSGVHENGVLALSRPTQTAGAPAGSKGQGSAPREPIEVVRDKKFGFVMPSSHAYLQGRLFIIGETNEMLVAASGIEEDGYFQVEVGVINRSNAPVDFFPVKMTASDFIGTKVLKYYPPEEIAKKIRRRMAWASALQGFSNSMASAPRTSSTSGSFTARDQYGNTSRGTYYGTTTTQPDYGRVNRENAETAAANRTEAEHRIGETNASALRANTIMPGKFVIGTVSFEKADHHELESLTGEKTKSFFVSVLIPVGNEKFLFLFSAEDYIKYQDHKRQLREKAQPK